LRDAEEVARLVAAGLVPCLAYLALGLRALGLLGVAARGAERLALAYVLGTGAASLGILALRALGVPVPLLAAGAVALLAWPRPRSAAPAPRRASAAGWVRAVDAASGALGALIFLAALGPETAWDGFEYHLPLVAAWTEGPLRAVPGLLDAEFRAGVDLLYVPAVTSGWPDAAASVSAGFALALAALVRAEAGRRASPAAGSLAGLFSLLVPGVVELAPTTYVDLGFGAYGFVALLSADRWSRLGERRDLLLCASCLGFAANAKLHGVVLWAAALALLLLGGRRPGWRDARLVAGVALGLALPWLLKTWLTTGNPFFPFLGDWLGYGPTDARNIELRRLRILANQPGERDLPGLLGYLASITFGRNPHVSGLLGPLPLALAPWALAGAGRPARCLAATAAVLLVLQFTGLPALRFGAPLWPLAALAAAVGGRRLAASGAAGRRVLSTCLALLALHAVAAALAVYLPRIAALREPAAYERSVFPDQDALRRMVAQAEPVVAIPMGAVSWMPRPVCNLLWRRSGERYFVKGTPPARALALLRQRDVRSLVIDVESPLAAAGRTGHPIVDAWLEQGLAVVARDVEPLAARAGRVWVLVRLRSEAPRPVGRPSGRNEGPG
jgi:hypothetical protein